VQQLDSWAKQQKCAQICFFLVFLAGAGFGRRTRKSGRISTGARYDIRCNPTKKMSTPSWRLTCWPWYLCRRCIPPPQCTDSESSCCMSWATTIRWFLQHGNGTVMKSLYPSSSTLQQQTHLLLSIPKLLNIFLSWKQTKNGGWLKERYGKTLLIRNKSQTNDIKKSASFTVIFRYICWTISLMSVKLFHTVDTLVQCKMKPLVFNRIKVISRWQHMFAGSR